MSSRLLVAPIVLLFFSAIYSPECLARSRKERTGFTFGTTLRMIDHTDRSNPSTESSIKSQNTGQSTFVSPYIGYSFGTFSLGLSYASETKSNQITEISESGATLIRNTSQVNRGGALFSRFLFASVFFFETGVGLFQDTMNVETENRTPQDSGSFEGKTEAFSVKGTGPGYHAAFGIELPITYGFFFTSLYQTRMVTLWDYKGGSNLGSKRSQTQKREVLFGIAYYNQ